MSTTIEHVTRLIADLDEERAAHAATREELSAARTQLRVGINPILAERADRYEADAAQLPEALRRMHAAEASVARVRELCASGLMLTPREVLAAIDGSDR